MTAENILYAVAIGVASSLLTTIFLCLVFHWMEPKHDNIKDILIGLRKPQWKVTKWKPKTQAEKADEDTVRIMMTWK